MEVLLPGRAVCVCVCEGSGLVWMQSQGAVGRARKSATREGT